MTLPYPRPTSVAVSAVMRANTKTNTKPELQLRSALHARGLRFRKDYPIAVPGLRVRADVAFTRQRVAVFMDGCFWHSCPDHGTSPKSNGEYWSEKLRRNRERDDRVNRALTDAGWLVVRLWEHLAIEDAVSRVLPSVRNLESPASRAGGLLTEKGRALRDALDEPGC